MQNRFKNISAFIIVILVLTLGAFISGVQSSQLDSVSGFAWGSDDWVDLNSNGIEDGGENFSPAGGMGWLSFNCISGGNCGASNYGVTIDENTGNITGYAWSSNYGWLKFGGLNGFPTSPGTTSANAKLESNNEVTGWARFCGPAASPSSCNGFVPSFSNGGWDGWVSLRADAPATVTYGVSLSGTEFSGYAWGGNDGGKNVVGWISFNCTSGGDCGDSDYKVIHDPITGPVVTLQANPINIPVGGTTTLSWTGLNLPNDPVGCEATNGAGGWAGARPSPSGSYTTTAISTADTYVFNISCDDGNGGAAVAEVTVNVGIQLDFYAEPSIAYPPAYEVDLHWNAVPNTPNGTLTSCLPTSVPSVPEWDNLNIADIPPAGSALGIPVPTSPTRFTLTCVDGIGNDVTKDVYVNRGTLPESVAFYNTAVYEDSPDYRTDLTWTTINIVQNSCVATNDSGDPLVDWDGAKDNPESGTDSKIGVKVPPVAPAFTTYTITCTGLYSGNSIAVSLYLNQNSGSGFNKVAPKYIEK